MIIITNLIYKLTRKSMNICGMIDLIWFVRAWIRNYFYPLESPKNIIF